MSFRNSGSVRFVSNVVISMSYFLSLIPPATAAGPQMGNGNPHAGNNNFPGASAPLNGVQGVPFHHHHHHDVINISIPAAGGGARPPVAPVPNNNANVGLGLNNSFHFHHQPNVHVDIVQPGAPLPQQHVGMHHHHHIGLNQDNGGLKQPGQNQVPEMYMHHSGLHFHHAHVQKEIQQDLIPSGLNQVWNVQTNHLANLQLNLPQQTIQHFLHSGHNGGARHDNQQVIAYSANSNGNGGNGGAGNGGNGAGNGGNGDGGNGGAGGAGTGNGGNGGRGGLGNGGNGGTGGTGGNGGVGNGNGNGNTHSGDGLGQGNNNGSSGNNNGNGGQNSNGGNGGTGGNGGNHGHHSGGNDGDGGNHGHHSSGGNGGHHGGGNGGSGGDGGNGGGEGGGGNGGGGNGGGGNGGGGKVPHPGGNNFSSQGSDGVELRDSQIVLASGMSTDRVNNDLIQTDLTRVQTPKLLGEVRCRPLNMSKVAMVNQDKDESVNMVALDPRAPYSFEGDNETVILASSRTKFNSAGYRSVSLKEGELTIVTGSKPAAVKVATGDIQVPANSFMVINQSHGGAVHVANIDGPGSNIALSFKGNVGNTKLKPGQEVTFYSGSIASSGVSDYATSPDSSSQVAGLNMAVRTMPHPDSAVRKLRECKSGCMTIPMRNRVDRIISRFANSDESEGEKEISMRPVMELAGDDNLSLNDSEKIQSISSSERTEPASISNEEPIFTGIALVTPVLDPALRNELLTMHTDRCSVKYTSDSVVTLSSAGVINLQKGSMLVLSPKGSTIKAGKYMVQVKRNSVVMLTLQSGVLKIHNLVDTAHDSVQVAVSGQWIPLPVGSELVVADQSSQVIKAMSKDTIGRRRMLAVDVDDAAFCSSEFSMPSLIQSSPLLRRVFASISRSDRKIKNNLMKISVCLMQTTGSHGAYNTISSRATM